MSADFYQQQQIEEERMHLTVRALQAALERRATYGDLEFLARELGVLKPFNQMVDEHIDAANLDIMKRLRGLEGQTKWD